jgi:ring-1,2-phenylacetyl-CoA epoxidase subunit PaaE
MRQFHKLTVKSLGRETADSLRLLLDVPDELAAEFEFLPGQHLPVQLTVDGKKLRRTYSISSPPGVSPLQLGIRIQPGGRVSEYLAENLAAGDQLEVMPPFGQFHAEPAADHNKTYLAFAAGSGITPILSIMRALLEREPQCRVVLFYGNRQQRTAMFIDDLYALKNRFAQRLQLYFLFSREEQEFPIFSGRLDGEKTKDLVETFCVGLQPEEAFVCGPDSMIESVSSSLSDLGLDKNRIHAERYGAPRKKSPGEQRAETALRDYDHDATVTVIMDGHQKTFGMASDGPGIVDAAAQEGIDLPYSCKGGVCATCRTLLRAGEVRMDSNYGLEPWEVEKGFILACQSHPVSDKIVLDYDET